MTTLSAMRFLSVLHKKLKSDCVQIYLAEAMLTFKNKKPVKDHKDDAEWIYDRWEQEKKLQPNIICSVDCPTCEGILPCIMDGVPVVKRFEHE